MPLQPTFLNKGCNAAAGLTVIGLLVSSESQPAGDQLCYQGGRWACMHYIWTRHRGNGQGRDWLAMSSEGGWETLGDDSVTILPTGETLFTDHVLFRARARFEFFFGPYQGATAPKPRACLCGDNGPKHRVVTGAHMGIGCLPLQAPVLCHRGTRKSSR
jgi:hypothetical protein